jgi:transposase
MLQSPEKIKFLSAMPFTSNFAKSQVESVRNIIDSFERTILIGDSGIKGITRPLMWDSTHKVYVHIFYNDSASFLARKTLDMKLAEIRDNIQNGKKILKKNEKFLRLLNVEKSSARKCGFIIKYKYDVIDKRLANSGWMVAITNSIKSAKQAIEIYRAKDVVEKSFYMIKNLLDFDRIRCHADKAMQNKLFIFFISLILMSHVHKVMVDNNLYSSLTMKELFKTMNRHKALLIKGKKIIKPATLIQKKFIQHLILQHLNHEFNFT